MPSDNPEQDTPVAAPDNPEQDTPAVAPEPATAESAIDSVAIVDKWWADTMPGSPLARVTEAYNHVYEAVQDLKTRLKGAR